MTWWYLAAAVGLLLANGFFVGAEFALIAARSNKIETLAEQGDRRAKVAARSLREISFMLAGTQLGITMASLGLGFVAEPAVAHLIQTGLGRIIEVPHEVLHTISIVLGLGIVVFLHMVIGEMAPKNIAISEPEKAALWIAYPYRFYANLFRPLIRLLSAVAGAALKLMGIEQKHEFLAAHSPGEIGLLIQQAAQGGMLTKSQHRLLSGAAGFGDRDAASAMVPRTELVAVPVTISPAELEGVVLASGHSRIPVYEEDLDHLLGFFHAKDLLRIDGAQREQPLDREFVRPMLVVPESKRLHPLLFEMRRERRHFALVVEEHGGTAGVVTLEDLLEELVGEIRDEYDVAELGVERLEGNRFLVPGSLRIDELKDRLEIDLPDGEYETIAGFLMDQLGRIPRRRDAVTHAGWRLRVMSMHRRRVVQVLVEPI
jgi:CBS domain containing-hemolysin-like protein